MGLPQYIDKFEQHEVTEAEIPYLKESHLVEMGIVNVGDRLRILDFTSSFLRGLRNQKRQKTILNFKDWYLFPCWQVFAPQYRVTESAIEVRTPKPCMCKTETDNVDITSIQDMRKTTWCCCLGYIYIATNDPSMQFINMRLSTERSRTVYGVIKNLWEEDQLKMGRRGHQADAI